MKDRIPKDSNCRDYRNSSTSLLPGEPPVVTIEEAPLNARRIFATVDVHASSDGVWNVLTAYEKLQRVVPSLVKNDVLFRTEEGGARLSQVGVHIWKKLIAPPPYSPLPCACVRQVGGAKVLPGITFTAKTVLDVAVFLESSPLPESMLAVGPPAGVKAAAASDFYRNEPLRRGRFPRPAVIPSLPKRDITMQVGPLEECDSLYASMRRVIGIYIHRVECGGRRRLRTLPRSLVRRNMFPSSAAYLTWLSSF